MVVVNFTLTMKYSLGHILILILDLALDIKLVTDLGLSYSPLHSKPAQSPLFLVDSTTECVLKHPLAYYSSLVFMASFFPLVLSPHPIHTAHHT